MCDLVSEEKRKSKMLMTASLMMLGSLLVSEILVISVFRVTGVSWSHRFVCDVASLLVILLEEREAPMLMVASWTTLVSYLPFRIAVKTSVV